MGEGYNAQSRIRCQRHTTIATSHGLTRLGLSERLRDGKKRRVEIAVCAVQEEEAMWYRVDADRDAMPSVAELKDKLTAFCNFVERD